MGGWFFAVSTGYYLLGRMPSHLNFRSLHGVHANEIFSRFLLRMEIPSASPAMLEIKQRGSEWTMKCGEQKAGKRLQSGEVNYLKQYAIAYYLLQLGCAAG